MIDRLPRKSPAGSAQEAGQRLRQSLVESFNHCQFPQGGLPVPQAGICYDKIEMGIGSIFQASEAPNDPPDSIPCIVFICRDRPFLVRAESPGQGFDLFSQ